MMLLRAMLWGWVVCLLWSGVSWAAEADESTETMPEITVVDQAVVNTPGKSVLDRKALQALPQGDGAITDLLRVLPGVQFSEADNSSLTGGEILPPEVSISGGRIYDNNFMIDGLGNNSLLDPTFTDHTSRTGVPGHSQELFLDTSLIENVSIHRSNISARYSGFTGGVIDVETIDPSGYFGGEISVRTTRSEWTSFHVDREEEEEFLYSSEPDRQPEFRKYYGQVMVDVPLTEKMAAILAYSQAYSQIPLWSFGEKEKQYRQMENYFGKLIYRLSDATNFRLTYLSTPYEGEYFRDDAKNSDYSVEGGGWSLSANLTHQFSIAEVEFIVGWKESENNKTAPQDYFIYNNTPSVDWGEKYSKSGGYGDIEKDQQTLTVATHLTFEPVSTGWFDHEWIAGITLKRITGREERAEATSIYTAWQNADDIVCVDGSADCISNEQFAWYKTVYPEYEADGELTILESYLEDSITLDRVTWRPGLNLSYNDLNKNMDYAWRNTVFVDLFGDGRSILSAGANRYYGKSLLSHALEAERLTYSTWKRSKTLQIDNFPEPWVEKPRTSFRETRFSDLKTPRVDEWSIGLEQVLFGGNLTVAYLDRNTEDSLTLDVLGKDENGYIFSEWSNLGHSRHKEASVTWERSWGKHYLLIDGTWQRSFSTNEDYADNFELEDLEDLVWYEDQLKLRTDLPRSDYNRKWSANLVYRVELDHGLSFSNTTRYRSGYEGITDTKENHTLDDGTKVDIYAKRDYPSATTFDWKLEWQYPLSVTQQLTLTADVYNVFNRKVYSGIEGQYQMGRQLWVGMEYDF